MDFIDIQNYTREIAKHSHFTPFIKAKIISAEKRKVHRTLMNWEVYPPAIYHMLKRYSSYRNSHSSKGVVAHEISSWDILLEKIQRLNKSLIVPIKPGS